MRRKGTVLEALIGRLRGFGNLVPGSQAPGAKVESFRLAVYIYSGRVNIRQPAAVGMAFGMADIMTELR